MSYSIRQIGKIIGAEILQEGSPGPSIEQLLIDSRQLVFAERSLFFAMTGTRHDGHQFIADLYERGLRNFVISRKRDLHPFPGANILFVKNTLNALQDLAAYHRRQLDLPVIGITGSNGKTIVKEWLFQLLHDDYRCVRSPRSYNSQTGVPLSIWQIRPEHELGIFEAGISTTGEMEKLAPVIQCRLGIFTNIGEAHSGGFPSRQVKIREKLKLFEKTALLFYCADHEDIDREIQKMDIPAFRWSRQQPAELRIRSEQVKEGEQTIIEGLFKEQSLRISIPFTDAASVENAIYCWAVSLYLGIDPAIIAARMRLLEAVGMRLELKEGINNCSIINDSYNSDINSLSIALNFLQQQRKQARHTLILSDLLGSKLDREGLYEQVARLLEQKKINRFIGIGQAVPAIKKFLDEDITTAFYPDTETFLKEIKPASFHEEAILLKGARPFAFERIAQRLAQKIHRTTLEVDLNALVHNLNVYHQYLDPSTRIMVMVKASAYGSGSLEVARLLEFHQIHYLAVAYADEGIELRQGGIGLPVLVLNPEEDVFDSMVRYRLEPEIYSLALLKQYAAFVANLTGLFSIHLKLETGMNRLGFESNQLEELISILNNNPQLQVRSIFSHLAASESSKHDTFTRQQIMRFESGYHYIASRLGYRPLRHILNSSGIARFPQYQMDMIRLGLGIYGIDSSGLVQNSLRKVLSLHASISQIKDLPPGESVGYGRAGKAPEGMRIATVSIGYADGLPRASGKGRYSLLVRGRRAPIVGNVCMDMCMIDISQIPEAREGDSVCIFGVAPGVEELAEACQTIPYEIFTGISGRVKRVYVQE